MTCLFKTVVKLSSFFLGFSRAIAQRIILVYVYQTAQDLGSEPFDVLVVILMLSNCSLYCMTKNAVGVDTLRSQEWSNG